jgi:hypothetical protein
VRLKHISVLVVGLALVMLDVTPALAATPNVTSFDPTSGGVGTSVVISGDGFDTATAVSFNGTAALFNIDSAVQITATVPAGATTGPISATNPDGTGISATNFTVVPAPQISDFSPTHAAIGSTVVITGADFDNVSEVRFNGTPATITGSTSTTITVKVPVGATSGPIAVTTPGGTDQTVQSFQVIRRPKIKRFTPHRGPIGTRVTITGNRQLKWVTRVWFGSQAANFAHITPRKLRARVPRGFRDAHIRAKNQAGFDTSDGVFHQRRDRVRSRVTLSLAKHLRASGAVRAGRQICEGQRLVLIQRVVSGHWKTVKKVRAGARGGYAASLPDNPGTYRAVIKKKRTLTVQCLPDVSGTATHAHSSGGGGGGGGGSSCTPGYSPCLVYHGGADYDCAGGSGDGPYYTKPGVVYSVTGSDPYGLDSDNDGRGCE